MDDPVGMNSTKLKLPQHTMLTPTVASKRCCFVFSKGVSGIDSRCGYSRAVMTSTVSVEAEHDAMSYE